ncbi:tRNA wybutosine-synthesizing protein 3 homolog isoform X2 [Ornithorhynchus anatinus]|uniref:tRNA wybutosine-synthesizing protein 3 homolog isoform X2 n=1 Tax=Ornithorhynchus anatinus TaxID=9258 RepID=UPI0010A92E4A|nr:tRNA wybutosine-synthesizing protein 3 homolog isoform X2 [Ornithorhynchus anatinus]
MVRSRTIREWGPVGGEATGALLTRPQLPWPVLPGRPGRRASQKDSDHFEIQKQNCSWLLVTHQLLGREDLILALQKASGDAVLKFEPFVLHVQCRELQDAQLLHSVAIESGFRNSGITVGRKGKTMMAVRSTHVLEVPLSHKGKLMVSQEYIDFLIQIANEKMEENKRRIERFYSRLQLALKTEETPNNATAEKTPVVYTRRRKRNPERAQDSRVSPEKADARLESDGDSEIDLGFFLEKY